MKNCLNLQRTKILTWLLGILLAMALVWTSMFAEIHGDEAATMRILLYIRIPRTVGAILAGTALSAAGFLLQEALHNPLASPSVLGINNGAGLFALAAGLWFPQNTGVRYAFAFAGSMLAVLLVYLVVRRAGSSKTMIVLAGVAVSALFSAGVNSIITFYPETVADKAAFTLGGLTGITYPVLISSAVLIVLSLLCAFFLCGGIDLFALGDEAATGVGLSVKTYRTVVIFLAAILAASAVCIGGLISFVGLIVPNLVRKMGQGNQNAAVTLGMSILYGSNLVLLADVLARRLLYPYELPVGLLLSLLGSPFFIWMLIHRRRSR